MKTKRNIEQKQNKNRKHKQLKTYDDGNLRVLDFVIMRRREENL